MIFLPSNNAPHPAAEKIQKNGHVNKIDHRAGFASSLAAATALWFGCIVAASPVSADVYRWVADDGTVNYGEREPRGREFTVISRSTAPPKSSQYRPPSSTAATSATNSERYAPSSIAEASDSGAADDNLSDRQKALLDRLKADEERRQESIAEIRKSNCATSKRVLSQMQSRGRIRVRNDSGEEIAMSDDDRNERIRQAQKSIAVNCDSVS